MKNILGLGGGNLELREVKRNNEILQTENYGLKKENEDLQQGNRKLEQENETLQTENGRLKQENKRLQVEIDSLKQKKIETVEKQDTIDKEMPEEEKVARAVKSYNEGFLSRQGYDREMIKEFESGNLTRGSVKLKGERDIFGGIDIDKVNITTNQDGYWYIKKIGNGSYIFPYQKIFDAEQPTDDIFKISEGEKRELLEPAYCEQIGSGEWKLVKRGGIVHAKK